MQVNIEIILYFSCTAHNNSSLQLPLLNNITSMGLLQNNEHQIYTHSLINMVCQQYRFEYSRIHF